MPLAVGVCSHRQNSFAASTDLPRAVLNVPACEYDLRRSGGGEPLRGPSKFAGLRRVICRRTRSPVPGRMNVPFLSFCCKAPVSVPVLLTAALGKKSLRCVWRIERICGLMAALGHLKPSVSSFLSFLHVLHRLEVVRGSCWRYEGSKLYS
jgi:hypothetical protein